MINKKTVAIVSILILITGLVFLLTACKAPASAVNDSVQPAPGQEELPPGTVIKQTTGQIKFKLIPPPDESNTSVSI